MSSTTRALCSLAAVAALCATTVHPRAAQESQDPQSSGQEPSDVPVFRGAINAVRVDVLVTDGQGQAVTDLTIDDFELFEDGAPQPIQDFTVVRIGESSKEYRPPQIRSALDEEAEAARDDVRLFLIYVNTSPGGLSHTSARRALEPLVDFVRGLDPADMVGIMDRYTPLAAVMLTRDRDWTVRTIRSYGDPEVAQRHERALLNRDLLIQPYRAIDALEAASLRLARLRDGRQSIIIVGAAVGAADEYPRLLRTLNRNNTAVYVLDPSGPRIGLGALARGMADLRELAEDTGGYAIVSTNEIEEGLARVAQDATFHYLLTYDSSAPADGRFHRIDVRVKRPGLRVQARSGYSAFSNEEMLRAAAARPAADGAVLDARAAIAPSRLETRAVQTWVGTAQGENGRTRVTFVWEPVAPSGEPDDTPARISLLARGPDGAVIFEGVAPDAEAAVAAAAPARDRARHQVTFAVPSGPLDLQVSVESAGGDLLDVEAYRIDAVDYASVEAGISTPRLFVARTIPELRLLREDPGAAPTAGREFLRSDRLLIRFDAYGAATPRAALLNRTGEEMSPLDAAPGHTGGTHEVELGLSHIPPGEYLIEVRPVPGSPSRALIAFRVGTGQ